jgi:hypothetical protein
MSLLIPHNMASIASTTVIGTPTMTISTVCALPLAA